MALAVASIVLYASPGHWSCRNEKVFHLIVLGLWLVVPPVWFMVEARWVKVKRTRAATVKLKETQEFVTKIWAGISALLGVLGALKK